MSKPTFIQTLLNRPSQSYLQLQQQQEQEAQKDVYYSAKSELLRRYSQSITAEGASRTSTHNDNYSSDHYNHYDAGHDPISFPDPFPQSVESIADDDDDNTENYGANGFTAPTALQQRQPSISSVVAAGNPKQASSSSSKQQPRTANNSNTSTGRTRSPLSKTPNTRAHANNKINKNAAINPDSDDESDLDGFDSSEDDDDLDIFYTPNQSPRTSLASSSILFPSQRRPGNRNPRQASRRSLGTNTTTTNASRSSLAPVAVIPAPGTITASNSGSGSIKPGHVNGASSANSPSTSSHPFANLASTSLPLSSMVQHRQQQQRLSSSNPNQTTTTTNGALNTPVPRKPVPSAASTPSQQQQAVVGSKAGQQQHHPTLTRKAPISSTAVSAPHPSAARDPPRTAPAAPSLNQSPAPSRSSSLRVPNKDPSSQAPPTKVTPNSKSSATRNAPSSGAPSPNSSFTSTDSAAALAALGGGGGGGSSASSTSQPSPASSLRTNNTTPKTSTSTLTPPSAATAGTVTPTSATSGASTSANGATTPTPTPKRKRIPSEARNSSSTISLTSTTLENHSDLFSATSGSDMGLTDSSSTPVGGVGDGKTVHRNSKTFGGSTKPLASSPLAQSGVAQQQQQNAPTRSNSLRATRTPVVLPRPSPAGVVKPKIPATYISKVAPPPVQQKSYTYTDDDWARDVRSLVNLHSQLEENLNEEARAAAAYASGNANGAAVKRNASSSSRKEEHRKSLGRGLPVDLLKGGSKERDASGNSSGGAVDKGKAKEKDDVSPAKEGKTKRKKTSTVEREVVYYTATHGMPRPVTNGAPQIDGSANGSASGSQQQQPPRNGYAHHMMMTALYEEDEASDGRLSVVTERDEPETPTHPTPPPNGAEGFTPVFNPFGSSNLRLTANASAQPVEMIRRRSRSLGEQDSPMLFTEEPLSMFQHHRHEQQHKPRQSSVASWADEYKEILARSRGGIGQAMASGTSLLSSPSQQSFAYRSALPVPSGEMPSQGTPGFTGLHLARAPPGVYVKDGELHQRLPGVPPTGDNGGMFGGRGGVPPHVGFMNANGRVDLTRSGIAQTTMASVEVLKGLSGSSLKRGLSGVFGLGRRRTVSEGVDVSDGSGRKRGRLRKGSEDVNARGQGTMENGDHTTAARQHMLNVAGAAAASDKVLGFTGYRRPPTYVPSTSVLVQVWAVGVDGVDAKLVGLRMGKRVVIDDEDEIDQEQRGAGESGSGASSGANGSREEKGLGRSMSLRQRIGSLTRRKNSMKGGRKKDSSGQTEGTHSGKGKDKQLPMPPVPQPDVGYIPGRGFVGRVLEVGWDVKDETIRKGEWVTGLLDVRKGGALTEFIVVDRHRIHRVPYPVASPPPEATPAVSSSSATTTSTSSGSSSRTAKPAPPSTLTVEETALLALCGVPAYRAVRTFMSAFSAQYKAPPGPRSAESGLAFTQNLKSDHEEKRRRRALVLRGHDGVGAMVVQMLVLRNWRVSVHVPVPGAHDTEDARRYMSESEERVRKIGGEEVIFDDGGLTHDPWWDDGRAAAVRVIDGLREDGDVFDAVLDTMGGREIREASERLLRSNGGPDAMPPGGATGHKAVLSLDNNTPRGRDVRRKGIGQFTTLVGEVPERVIPTTADNFRAGLRSLKFSSGNGTFVGDDMTKVGYAWISAAQDVDWEGENVAESIGHVLRLALEHGVRPIVPRASTRDEYSPEYAWQPGVIPFEKAPDIFINGDGPLSAGGTMVVKVAAD
ncbi:hypothetical protein MD484_g2172, partial [Candolleomyces efflorescens]